MSVSHEIAACLLVSGQTIYSRPAKLQKKAQAAAMDLFCQMKNHKILAKSLSHRQAQNSFLSMIRSLTFTDTAIQITIATIIAIAICHPANTFSSWKSAFPL